jgi:hypothetical protein
MDPQLKAQLKQSITITPMTGIDYSTGEPTYGTARSHACRITGKIQRITNAQGEEVVSMQQIVLEGPVSHMDKVTLGGTTHSPKAVANHVDEKGRHDYSMIYL